MTGVSTEGLVHFNGANPFSPVGTILGPGSTSLRMTAREFQVATLVSMGYNYKKIANVLGMSSKADVGKYVAEIAARVPGQGKPQQKVSAWMWTYGSAASDAGE